VSTAEDYEAAEGSYLDALRVGASPSELATAARAVSSAAAAWESAAYRRFFDARASEGDIAREVIEMEIEAEKAELLHELWADIAAAHAAA